MAQHVGEIHPGCWSKAVALTKFCAVAAVGHLLMLKTTTKTHPALGQRM